MLLLVDNYIWIFLFVNREDPKEDDNNNFENISNESLTPANFSRAFFKSASREIPIEVDRQSNQPPAVNIFDVLKDVSVFHFSASTPRNLVVEDSALKSRFQSSRSLKRHYDYVHEEWMTWNNESIKDSKEYKIHCHYW